MAFSKEEYNACTDELITTFGQILNRDLMYGIVENCSGDVNLAANAIMAMISGADEEQVAQQETLLNQSNKNSDQLERKKGFNNNNYAAAKLSKILSDTSRITINQTASKPSTSYASRASTSKASTSRASTSKASTDKSFHCVAPIKGNKNDFNLWTSQIKEIVTHHNKGSRTLIIMRGAPGSGKSYLAQQIIEITVGSNVPQIHIFSTDDYFYNAGVYRYDRLSLQPAHAWNQRRAAEALDKGVSPVIIDNTNVEYWEIEPYVRCGVFNGYLIEVVEPNTPWARSISGLMARNTHGVPEFAIKRMLDSLSTRISSKSLIAYFNLVYSDGMQPPVLRFIPKIPASCENAPCVSERVLKSNEPKSKKCLKENVTVQESWVIIKNDLKSNIAQTSNNNEEKLLKCETVESGAYENKSNSRYDKLQCDEVVEQNSISEHKYSVQNDSISDPQDNVTVIDEVTMNIDREITRGLEYNDPIPLNINAKEYIEKKGESEGEYDGYIGLDQNHNKFKQLNEFTDDIRERLMLQENSKSQILQCIEQEEKLDELQKFEKEWDNGEAWEEDSKVIPNITKLNITTEAKPPRIKKSQEKYAGIPTLDDVTDWRKISMFMPSWTDNNNGHLRSSKKVIETKSTETRMEVGDTNISSANQYKIVDAIPRDININHVPNSIEQIPDTRMLDKSSTTNEPFHVTGANRCKNEEKHFIRFRKMFPNKNEDDLRDIFEKCCGDVNWAGNIVLEDMDDKQSASITVDKQSDTEEENEEACECMANYNIIPDVTSSIMAEDNINISGENKFNPSNGNNNVNLNFATKQKKEFSLSETSLALKRQIEQNIVISETHYSQECLKLKRLRHGLLDASTSQINTDNNVSNMNDSNNTQTFSIDMVNMDQGNQDNLELSTLEYGDFEYESDDESGLNEFEKSVTINLGHTFLKQLDAYFGREDMAYSKNIEPRIKIPISLLNELNALWMESFMHQLETESKIREDLIKKDEQFARELVMKHAELSDTGTGDENAVPDFKQIMDMEFALHVYRKECGEWQKDRPTDLATKLSIQKLYNLFPDVSTSVLDEIYVAHHNDFQTTVGVLLVSSGRSDIVEQENGINKFVMREELIRQEKFLAEEKERLNKESQWPALPSNISLQTVEEYRQLASNHLAKWQLNSEKAYNYMIQRIPLVSNYYSDVAHFHQLKYEQANCVAAASLMQFHASTSVNDVTLDLHYLRVAEAREALDIFLDTHIRKLKESKGGKQSIVLFLITGRGLHSPGGPKIKPAIRKRLLQRGLGCAERNPGLLTAKVRAVNLLSYEIT